MKVFLGEAARLAWEREMLNRDAANFDPIWVAGFMSGTSLDAVDAVLIKTDGETIFEFGPATEHKYTAEERAILQHATDAARAWNWVGLKPESAFSEARRTIVSTHEAAWKQLLIKAKDTGLSPDAPQVGDRIMLLGVHGQTVLPRRPTDMAKGATVPLMDGPALAVKTGLPVAHNFRSADVEAGGEGAPLAPIYHKALLERLGGGPAVVLNLGGVANITARLADGSLLAFDTGPANGPIDEWVEGHDRGTHDAGGCFAAAGHVHEGLLAGLFEHPWFSEAPPKSLDRYDFNASMARGLSFEDGAATLTAFSARAVAAGIAQLPQRPTRIIACGGGRHNPTFMTMLADALPCPLLSAEDAGWRGDSIEAEAFALLAVRTLRGLPISFPGTTGVREAMLGGLVTKPIA
jgi:anhydro-N-acetylmuramic acid kinase